MAVLGTISIKISIADLILVGLALVGVVWTLITGMRHLRRGLKISSFEPDTHQALAWKGWLTRVAILSPDSEVDAEALRPLVANWQHAMASSHIGRGAGDIISSIVCLPLVAAMLLSILSQQLGLSFRIFLLIGFLLSYGGGQLGASIGYVNGLTQVEAAPERVVEERGARSGRVSDYRSGLLLLVPVCLLAASIAMSCLFLVFFSGPGVSPSPSVVTIITDQARLWVAISFPALSALTVGTGEVFIHRIARVPPRLLTWSLSIARRADEMLHSVVFGVLFTGEVRMACQCLFFQGILLTVLPGSSLGNTGILIFSGGALAFFIASTAATRRLAAFQGRLGGKLTGWPRARPVA